MDRSSEHIVRCMKADEVQRSWEVEEADFYADRKEAPMGRIHILNDWETQEYIAQNKNLFVWIPRLDQLQKMVDWTRWEFRLARRINFELHFTPVTGPDEKGAVYGDSLEQVWLSFIMKALWHKAWDAKNGIWKHAGPIG